MCDCDNTREKKIDAYERRQEYQRQYYIENHERCCQTARERSRVQYNDPVFRELKKAQSRVREVVRIYTPEEKARRAKNKREKYHNDAEHRERVKQYMKDYMKTNPQYQQKISEMRKIEYAEGKAKYLAKLQTRE